MRAEIVAAVAAREAYFKLLVWLLPLAPLLPLQLVLVALGLCTQRPLHRAQILFFLLLLQLAVVVAQLVALNQLLVVLAEVVGAAHNKLARLELQAKDTLVETAQLMAEIILRLAAAVLVQ